MKREILFTVIFSFLVFFANQGFSQTSISGIINSYTAVDSIYPTKNTIEVANASAFTANDTVMIYQAKGAEPVTDTITQPYNFGGVRNADIKETGKYEIILVQKIEGNKIIFKAILNNDYDARDLIQLIRVPSYKNVSIDGELTCDSWDGINGGIIALMVSDTLFLNNNINATGKGFRGAIPFESNGECASTDSAVYGSQYFSENTNAIGAGFKGEGVAIYDTTYSKGLGRWANGGGGGNARFSGGGGGGNSGNGGYGGEEDTIICSTPAFETSPNYDVYWNALGGSDGFGLGTQNLVNDSTIFLGGGGGSGTYIGGLTASSGGNGGGIVVIIAKIIKSNGNDIIANGETVNDIADASGAGGGAGGTIVFDVDSVIGNLSVSVKGGDGGRVLVNGKSGPGGGGGGGPLLWNSTRPDNVTLESAGGASGYAEDLHPEIHTHKAKSGSVGTEKINIKVPLTGFLFNSITSDQQVCMNDSSLIVGTEPRGGNGTFTFQWQDSPDGSVWSDISGATERDYQTPALSDTTYFQRIVTSGSIVDEGNEVEIIVHDYVVDNTIFGDDLITCIGNEADTITGTEVILGGDNISYQYIWESSTDQNAWNTISLLNDTVCLPGIVTDTTFIRRRVISGGCKDTAWLSNPIIGLPQILNNDLSPDQEICYGQIPDEIIGVEPSGGNGVYDPLYWEEKTESSSWSIVTDSTRYNFAPAELFETTYYRRIVESDDCFDVSDSIKINVLLPIDNDSINETELLIYTCYNIPPQLINGSTPTGGGGVGTYTYKWQESVDGLSWTDIASTDVEDYQAGALIVKTYFRRLVSSGLDGCCTSASDSIIIDIYPLPEATIADLIDTTCSGDEIILDFTITNGQIPYTLTYNDGETPSVINNIITTDTIHKVNPSTILESEEFNYTIDSVVDYNGCIATEITGLTKITVYGKPTADAGIDDEVCQLSYVLSATTSFDNTNGIWTQIPNDGSTDFDDNTLKNTGLEVTLAGLYSYIWEETNWQCEESDTVEITMYKNLYNIDIIRPFDKGDIDTILRFVEEVNFKGNYYNPDTFKTVIEKNWEVFNGDPGITISPSDTAKNVTFGLLNDAGNEYIEIQWHVDKGVCLDTTIIRRIQLDEIFEPTGFTPNGDGVNDYALFSGLENSDEHKVIIFNRWGTEVYSAENFSNEIGWDGKNKDGKDLPEDTYYYVLSFTKGNSTQYSKGFIVIKRF